MEKNEKSAVAKWDIYIFVKRVAVLQKKTLCYLPNAAMDSGFRIDSLRIWFFFCVLLFCSFADRLLLFIHSRLFSPLSTSSGKAGRPLSISRVCASDNV